MPLIPLPESKEKDIYYYGFDKNLNRTRELETKSAVVYSSINDLIAAQTIQFGALLAGSQDNIFVADPTKGIWLGDANFADAPFKVNMQGDLTANSATIAGLTQKIQLATTDVTINETGTETTLWSFTLNANSLSTANVLRAILICPNMNAAATGRNFTFRMKYGATTVVSQAIMGSDTASKGYFDCYLAAAGATNSQTGAVIRQFFEPGAATLGNDTHSLGVDEGTATEDSTTDLTVAFTGQWPTGAAGETFTFSMGIAYIIR